MAMLRVSSYRKLFEDDGWSRNGGLSMQCAGQYRASVRSVAAVDKCDCDKLDFVAAKAINREGLNQFVKDRTIIAALNDRLVKLIELDEILCDTEELRKELECLMKEYEKAAQQRILFQQERQDVAEEVDAVTAGCLALREQVAIYEEQLANMEAQHKTAVEDLLEPADGATGAVAAIIFGSPDITPALDVKEYYCQLAENLQYECDAPSFAVVRSGDRNQLEAGGAAGSTVRALPKITDIGEMKTLISELQKELAELEKLNEELEDEVEMKKAAYMDEIAELECTIDEMRHQEADFQVQMKEQCEDYKELLSEKMARDMEISAYRS
ncbi:Peripherin, partial [Nibea albiflora]